MLIKKNAMHETQEGIKKKKKMSYLRWEELKLRTKRRQLSLGILPHPYSFSLGL